jgi:hypothetical protein
MTASLVIRKSTDVPSVTWLRTPLDEVVVDAVVPESPSQGTEGRPDGRAEEGREEDQPKEHAPEHPAQGAGAHQFHQLPGPGAFLPNRPGDDGRVMHLDQVLLLQVPDQAEGLICPFRGRKI